MGIFKVICSAENHITFFIQRLQTFFISVTFFHVFFIFWETFFSSMIKCTAPHWAVRCKTVSSLRGHYATGNWHDSDLQPLSRKSDALPTVLPCHLNN